MRKGTTLDDLAVRILAEVGADFEIKGLGSRALYTEYAGIPMVELEARYAADAKVDFDLALVQLEKNRLIGTGPWDSYHNPHCLVPVLYSKREYVFLTESGYRELRKRPARRGSPHPTVNISGGHFYQSPIGVGGTVNQAVNFEGQTEREELQRLVKIFEAHLDGLPLDAMARKKAAVQVATIKIQLEDEPDPVIVRQAGRTLRNVTEGTVASLIATAATTPGLWDWVHQAMPRLFG